MYVAAAGVVGLVFRLEFGIIDVVLVLQSLKPEIHLLLRFSDEKHLRPTSLTARRLPAWITAFVWLWTRVDGLTGVCEEGGGGGGRPEGGAYSRTVSFSSRGRRLELAGTMPSVPLAPSPPPPPPPPFVSFWSRRASCSSAAIASSLACNSRASCSSLRMPFSSWMSESMAHMMRG